MPHSKDLAFYRHRQQQAHERARLSTSPEARHVHIILAERYAELIEKLGGAT